MNRHLTSFIALGACVLAANGAQLTPEEALNRLNAESGIVRKVTATGKPELAYTAATGSVNQFYVFNNAGSNGFTIVAADDCVMPLLGFSEESSFDPADMPDNMKAWLESYQEQINWAIANGAGTAPASKANRADIQPLIKSRWGQDDPYNTLCPSYNGQKCATGCVATAMAQIMNFHQWPQKGKGSNSYRWSNQTLSMNFGNTTFDWANMTNTYKSSSTTEEKDAVALLMYACGISVDMTYGPSSGALSAKPATSLINYFDYDKGTTYYLRAYFSGSEWEQMIYDELAAKRPVMYDGLTGSNEGHEFVCDGYRDGYFHINWGWSGMSDGYFLLSALDPGAQGTGGGSSGFNFQQGATLGIQKPVEGSEAKATLVGTKEFYTDKSTYARNDMIDIYNQQYVYYPAGGSINAQLGLKFTDSDGKSQYILGPAAAAEFKGMSTYIKSYPMMGSDFPQSGTFTVKPAFYNTLTKKWSDILIPINYSQGFSVTIEGNSITFSPLAYDPQLKISDINVLTSLYTGKKFHVTATATVTGNEYYGSIKAALKKSGSNTISNWSSRLQIDVEPGQTVDIDMISEFTRSSAAGDYDFVFIDDNNNILSDPVPVKYLGTPLSTGIELVKFEPESSSMPQNHIKLNGTVKCVSGYFADALEIYLFEPNNNFSVTQWTTETLWINEGETADFTIEGEYLDGKTGLGSYTAVVYYNKNMMEPYAYFRLKKATNSIDDITTVSASVTPNPADSYITVTAEDIEQIDIYSIAGVRVLSAKGDGNNSLGIDVSGLAPGNYIVTVKGNDEVSTLRLIKR